MKSVYFSISLLLLISISKNILSQEDNPLLDQPPKQYWDYISTVTPKPMSVITDNSGYDNFDLGIDFAECHVSENPMNPLWYFIAYNTNATYYTINGVDWQRNNPFFPNQAGDPVTAYDSLGNLYYDNMKSPITGTWNVRSTNNGQNWFSAVSCNIGNDKNWIAADQTGGPFANYVYGTMTPGNFVRSIDHGASYSNTFSATNTLPGMMVCVGPNVMNGNNVQGGCVYVVTNTGSSFAATYTFYRSTNGGLSFDFMSAQQFPNFVGTAVGGRNSVENMRTRPYPFISADNSYGPFRGRFYVVYASNAPAGDGNKPDIFCRYSTDQGATWSSETRINDDANPETHNQWMPAPWCDKETGRLYVHWMDTRDCPTSDSALIYASYSTTGGASFAPNKQISNKKMRINCTTCGGGGTPAYLGDYNSAVSNSKTALLAWTDFRNGSFGSYVAYFPDFAMKTSVTAVNVNNGQNATFTASVPSVKSYTDKVKFSLGMDTLPASGTLNFSFVGKDSITSYPDSVTIRVEATGSVTPGRYRLKVLGRGPNGTPVHKRFIDVLVNSSLVDIGTNRPGICGFTVNGGNVILQRTQFVFTNGTQITVAAVSSATVGSTQYVYDHWSNGGSQSQNITVGSNLSLTAFYKTQYRLTISSSQGNTFGGGIFYDSASNITFGVNSRTVINGGTTYYFRGWTGVGNGSYTSSDSTGIDSAVTIPIFNPIVETARWTTTSGINQLGSEVPVSYNLYQNYPNPFNPSTSIVFDIVKTGLVKIVIYNMIGEEIEVLHNSSLTPGKYRIDFHGENLSSGIYYYRIEANDFVSVRKMLLIK